MGDYGVAANNHYQGFPLNLKNLEKNNTSEKTWKNPQIL